MRLWNLLKTDIDMSKRRNKILSALAVLAVATLAWIYLLPVLSPAGAWIATDKDSGTTAYIAVHENLSSRGYTVIVLSYTTNVQNLYNSTKDLKEEMNIEKKGNLVTAWAWRLKTLQRYPRVEPASRNMTLDDLQRRAAGNNDS